MVVAMQGGQRSMFSIEAILSSKGDEEKNVKAARTNSIRDGSLIINDKSKIVEDGSRIIGNRTEFLGGTEKVFDNKTFTPSRTPLSRSVSPIDTAANISPVTSPKSLRESSSPFEDDFIGKSMMFKDTSSLHSEYARSVRKDFLHQYTQSIRKDSLLDEEQLVKNSTIFGYDDDVFGKRYSQYNERSINPPTLERYDSPSCACQSCIERRSFSEKRKSSDQSFSSAEGYPSFSMHAEKCGGGGGSKRRRTIFTMDQLERLENEFQVQQYLVGQERRYLAKELGLNEVQVKVWFQNRRIKWRKSTRHHRISIN